MRVLLLLVLCGCRDPNYGDGHLKCATSGRACPENFYCAADQHCWKNGSGPDLSADVSDLAGVDFSGVDFASADLAGVDFAGVDLSHPPDLARIPDLAGVDAAPPSLCSGLGVRICDGFEGASLNGRWALNFVNGIATLDPTRSYRGGSSLHIHTNQTATAGSEPEANLITYQTLPLPSPAPLWARVWVYLPANNPIELDQLINFADASGTGISYVLRNGVPVSNDYGGGHYNESASTSLPTEKWFCMKVSISQGSATGPAHFYLGDTEVADIAIPSAQTNPMTHLYLGFDWIGTPANFQATDAWLDELIVDDKQVMCDE